jgi:NAD-dependent SIR2 family protein deacetylase
MPAYTRKTGARFTIVNLTLTSLDQHATVVIKGKAGEIMPRVMERVIQE